MSSSRPLRRYKASTVLWKRCWAMLDLIALGKSAFIPSCWSSSILNLGCEWASICSMRLSGSRLCGEWKLRVEMNKEKKACDRRERKGSRRERSEGDERGRRTRLEGEEINPLSLMTQLMQQFMPHQRHGRWEKEAEKEEWGRDSGRREREGCQEGRRWWGKERRRGGDVTKWEKIFSCDGKRGRGSDEKEEEEDEENKKTEA